MENVMRTYIGHYKRFGQPNRHMAVYRLEDGSLVNDQNVAITLDKRVLVSGPEDGDGEVCGCALCQRKARLVPKRGYTGCGCSEAHLRFYYCKCGARQHAFEAEAKKVIPMLSEEQIDAMVALDGAIERRTANRLGHDLEKLQLSTGCARSGDDADILTDFGKVVQQQLRDYRRVMTRLST